MSTSPPLPLPHLGAKLPLGVVGVQAAHHNVRHLLPAGRLWGGRGGESGRGAQGGLGGGRGPHGAPPRLHQGLLHLGVKGHLPPALLKGSATFGRGLSVCPPVLWYLEHRERETETDTETERQTETDRDRQRQTETDRDRERERTCVVSVFGSILTQTIL